VWSVRTDTSAPRPLCEVIFPASAHDAERIAHVRTPRTSSFAARYHDRAFAVKRCEAET
jgi:hypothetical protein